MKDFFGEDKVLNVATFSKLSSKTAIERACKGLNVPDATAGYLKSLVPVNRGKVMKLKEALYGENKVATLVAEMNKYPNLIESCLGLEGLIVNRGTHAAGVIVCNEPYTNYIAAMRSADGTLETCYDLWDAEEAGCIKFDMLTTVCADKIHKTMDLLLQEGKITWEGTLKQTYYKWLHPDVLDYKTKEMWDILPTIYSVFQFDTPISQKTLSATHPQSVMDLSAANSLLRLMPDTDETPIDRYKRYKESHEAWVQDTIDFGLNDEERNVLWEYLADAYGLADSQEKIMRLSMDKRVSGYTLNESNRLRKSIAKKDEKLQEEARKQFFEYGEKCGTREIFLDYIWNVIFAASMGYSFSQLHSYSYSIVALQELNLNYYYSRVYWNCACLSIEATGASDEGEDKKNNSTDYGEVAKAIYKMKAFGLDIDAPDINSSNLDFTPIEEQDTILYGIAGIASINSDIANQIIKNRPYASFDDFYQKNTYQGSLVTKSKIIQLIKAGCFDCFEPNRKKVMVQYAKFLYTNKPTLELNNIAEIKRLGIQLPIEVIAPYNFKKYVTSKQFYYSNHPKFKSKKIYRLDDKAKAYFMKNCIGELTEGIDYWYEDAVESIVIVDKSIEKTLKKRIEAIKEYINTPKFLDDFRVASVKQIYRDLADDNFNVNHWSFEATSYYSSGQHELASVRLGEYNIDHFAYLPVDPVFVEKSYGEKTWRQYSLNCIAGTVLDKNDNNHLVTILTADNEVVNIKFNGNDYAYYKSALENDKPWIKRGNLLMISGYRRGENDFVAKKYKSSIYPSLIQKIVHIYDDGDMDIITKREQEVEE